MLEIVTAIEPVPGQGRAGPRRGLGRAACVGCGNGGGCTGHPGPGYEYVILATSIQIEQ